MVYMISLADIVLMDQQLIFGIPVTCALKLPGFSTPQFPDPDGVLIKQHPAEPVVEQRLRYEQNILSVAPQVFGKLLITSRNTIEITPAVGIEDAHLATFILGSAMGSLLHLRQQIPLHGMAFLGRQGAILMLGESGTGKSTLTAAMLSARLPVFTDDVIALQLSPDNNVLVTPAHRQIKLSPSIVQALGLDHQTFSTTAPGVSKYSWHVPLEYFCPTAQPVVAIGILSSERNNSSVAQVTTISPTQAMAELLKNTYRKQLISTLGHQALAFRQFHHIAATIPMYQVSLPKITQSFDFADYSAAISRQMAELPLR